MLVGPMLWMTYLGPPKEEEEEEVEEHSDILSSMSEPNDIEDVREPTRYN